MRASSKEMLNMIQAQAIVQAATQRNTEVRIHQAFVETEARLHATAQSLVAAHANEQAAETRRALGEAIQNVLVDAHTRAHEQAMQAAHDRLSCFTKEIHQQIQAQLAHAVNEVGTKGVAYAERVTNDRLDLLRNEAQSDIEKSVEQAILRLTNGSEDGELQVRFSDRIQEWQSRLSQLQSELPRQLEESEKRCYDGAVSSSAAQAERIVAQAEGRLIREIGSRLGDIEGRASGMVSDAVVRAETHCNVIEKRVSETVDWALKDLRASRQLRTEVYVDRVVDEKLNTAVKAAVSKEIESHKCPSLAVQERGEVQRLTEVAVHDTVEEALNNKLDKLVERFFVSNLLPRVHSAVVSCTTQHMDEHFDSTLHKHVENLIKRHFDSKLRASVLGIITSDSFDFFDPMDAKFRACARDVAAAVFKEKADYLIREVRNNAISDARSMQHQLELTMDSTVRRGLDRGISDVTARLEGILSGQVHVEVEQMARARRPEYCSLGPSYSSPRAREPTHEVDQSASFDSDVINEALVRAYRPKSDDNQIQHSIDLNTGAVVNSRALLEARERAKHDQPREGAVFHQPTAPRTLAGLRNDEVQSFLCEYDQYCTSGGAKSWVMFVDPAVVSYLSAVECPDGSTDSEILQYLRRKVQETNKNPALLEMKFADIEIDPLARSSREKAESILLAWRRC